MGKKWYQKQLRMVQIVLREPDIVNYDAKSVVDYLVKSNANVIIINAGGIVDFFHSGLEGANLNPFMTDEDILRDLVEEAHKRDIRVVCRIDFRGAERDFSRAHPDWLSCNEDGSPKMMSTSLQSEVNLHLPCYNSRYMNEHAVDFLRSLFSQYDIDGIWENAVNMPHGVCYCSRCRTRYRKDKGKELPTSKELLNPKIREEYRAWKYICAEEHIARLKNVVKEFGDDKAYAAEIFGFGRIFDSENITVLDLEMGKENFDYFVTPAFVSQEANPFTYSSGLCYPASIVKHMKMISKDKQAVLLFGNNGGTLRYVRDPEMENKIWLWEAVSAGGGFWNCLFNGQHPAATHDNRAAYISKPMYDFLQANEEILEVNEPLAEVALYTSKPTRDVFGHGSLDRDQCVYNTKGVEKALVENHIQFVHFPGSEKLQLTDIQDYKAVILPNVACMSDHEIDVFRTYVEQGGALIASFETSLYDENGKRRIDLGLSELLGAASTGTVEDTRVDCYQLIRDYNHPLIRDIKDTELLGNAEHTLLVNALPGSEVATTYIPIIRNQPPEKAWLKTRETIYPVAMTNTCGKGKTVYFAFPIGRALFTYAHDDFVQLFHNALAYVLDDHTIVKTNAPASVHVQTILTGVEKDGIMLSLVNNTGTMYRPVQSVVPVHDIEMSICLVKKPREIRTLWAEHSVEHTMKEQEDRTFEIKFKIDRLDEFASVWISK